MTEADHWRTPTTSAMRLTDIRRCIDFEDDRPPSKFKSLLRAHLAGLLHALRSGHIMDATATEFIELVKLKWLDLPGVRWDPEMAAMDFRAQTLDALWRGLYSLLASTAAGRHLTHRGAL